VTRLLFVSNGHGEAAIAARIAHEARALAPDAELAHFPLVGGGLDGAVLREVGPRRTMPSGGLVAMGNVRAFARDLGAGFAALFGRQVRFLRGGRAAYDAAVAVGDVYALGMTLLTRLPAVFVGTAKSVYVAPYGPFERVVLGRAARIYVRDERTAGALRAAGVHALAPGNVIADLAQDDAAALPGTWIGLLPGSRAEAYADAVALAGVVRARSAAGHAGDALLSVAPSLEAASFAAALGADGWTIVEGAAPTPFTARSGEARIVAWSGGLGAIFRASTLVLGQAGTANEAAAASGLPVVALDPGGDAASDWYRMRQRKLLGEALALVPVEPDAAAEAIARLLDDEPRLAAMRAAGRERMGAPGGAGRIAAEALALAARNPAAS
jgi:uncharacterized protein (TIGR03492 family)